jgi:hypothetical protein
MLRWRVLHLPLPGAEWSSEDGSCPSRGMQGTRGGAARATSQRREPQYQEGGTSKLTKGVAEVLCGTHPGLCVADRRATIAPCPEARVASLRRTTIQRCCVPPGTAWRVDGAPQARRTGDDCAAQSPATVDRGAAPALQRSAGEHAAWHSVRRCLPSVCSSCLGFRCAGGRTRR